MAQPPPGPSGQPPWGPPPGPYPQPPIQARPPPRTSTKGLTRPKGALLLFIGLALGGFNVYSLIHDGHYYPKAVIFAPVAILFGLFAIIAGAPIDPQTGLLPLWIRVGYGASIAFGLALGIIAVVFVGC
jgi:hypothetical protein